MKSTDFETLQAAADWAEENRSGGGFYGFYLETPASYSDNAGDEADPERLATLQAAEAAGRVAIVATEGDQVDHREYSTLADAEAARVDFWLEVLNG